MEHNPYINFPPIAFIGYITIQFSLCKEVEEEIIVDPNREREKHTPLFFPTEIPPT
jgi:hypothetical protein